MRAPVEARNPVARIIGQARNIYHDSDTLMKYVKEITYFYSSEHKTSEEILQQLYEDVRVMVSSYDKARLFSGYDENHEKAKQFGVDFPTDKKYLDDMWGIAEALKYLFYITSKMKVFLSLDMLHDLKLEKVELRNPVQRVVFTKRQEEELKEHGLSAFQKFRKRGESIKKETIIRTVHDAAILDYKGEGYLKTVPEPTETILECFEGTRKGRQKLYEDYYTDNIGCSRNEMAENFYNLPMSKDFLLKFNKYKALFDFFIYPKEDSPSYNDFKPIISKSKDHGLRNWRNIMQKARKKKLGT